MLVTIGASRLKGEFSERTLAFIVWEKTLEQSGDDVEHSSEIGAMRPQMIRNPTKEFLGMTHERQHRKAGFDNHALIPRAFGTQFEIGRDAVLIAETQIGQRNTLIGTILDQEIEVLVRPVQRQPIPLDDVPRLVQQPLQSDANRPAPFILAFASNLAFRASFADGKEQLNRKIGRAHV